MRRKQTLRTSTIWFKNPFSKLCLYKFYKKTCKNTLFCKLIALAFIQTTNTILAKSAPDMYCMYICTRKGFEIQAKKSPNTVFNFVQINGSKDSCQKYVLQFLYSNNARFKIIIMFVHFSILMILQTDALYRPRSVSSSEGNFYDTSCCLWTQ